MALSSAGVAGRMTSGRCAKALDVGISRNLHRMGVTMLTGWDNFYVIVGSSAAALIGLQFVVIALIKDTGMRTTTGALSAFGTPTVLHLGGALVISALMSAPWQTLAARALAMGKCGIIGLAYSAGVTIHARRQSAYAPVWEDWLWHIILPIAAYASLLLGA